MATRSIASLALAFGLVSIPVKLYSATESAGAIKFKLMGRGGARLRQQYVADAQVVDADADADVNADVDSESVAEAAPAPERPASAAAAARPATVQRVVDFPRTHQPDEPPAPAVVERSEMVKGYEFEPGRYVLFTAAELKALADASRQTIDIVAFVPAGAVDPVYYDKAYFLAPDKRGAKPYSLLLRAMRDSGRTALAKWAWRAKEYVVQIRPDEGGLVLQQLLYADEVRSIADLKVDLVDVGDRELQLARQLIDQIAVDHYDPTQFVDEEKQRILAAVETKIAGRQTVAPASPGQTPAADNVVDLVDALRASLRPVAATAQRKPARRAPPAKTVRTRAARS